MVGEQSSKKAEISPPTSPPHRYNPLFTKAVHKIVSSTFGLCSCSFLHISSDRLTFCLFHPPNKRHFPWLSSPLLPTGLPLISFSWHTVSFLHVSPLKMELREGRDLFFHLHINSAYLVNTWWMKKWIITRLYKDTRCTLPYTYIPPLFFLVLPTR